MEKLPDDQSFECIFVIIKNGRPQSWYEAEFVGKYFLGLYSSHHSGDDNILLTSKRLTLKGEEDASDCGWVHTCDAKIIGWTKGSPPEKYRKGLIES